MKLCWYLTLCVFHITTISATEILKEFLQNKPGILGFLTKPQVPKFPLGIQVGPQGIQVGGGSFGFGFGFGISKPPAGVNVPPKDPHPEPPNSWKPDKEPKPETSWKPDKEPKPETSWKPDKEPKPETSWEDKDKVGPRPNWEEDTIDKPDSDRKEDSLWEPYEEENVDKKPSWDEIGEPSDDERSEDLLDSDLVGDKIINPRKPRFKRRVNSKMYHLPLKFMSNARPFKVRFHSHPNSLNEDKYA